MCLTVPATANVCMMQLLPVLLGMGFPDDGSSNVESFWKRRC
jgi:hypothetical protein